MALWILAGVFSLVGLPMIWLARRTFAKDDAIRQWPRAPGEVTSSGIEDIRTKVRDKNGYYYDATYHRAWVRYTYSIGGAQHEGKRISRQDDAQTSLGIAKRCVDQYPAGKRVEVLYDPRDQTVAFLEVPRSFGGVFLMAFGGLWLALAALFVVLSLVT